MSQAGVTQINTTRPKRVALLTPEYPTHAQTAGGLASYAQRIARFLDTGAPPPEGVTLRGRWFTAGHNKGFMLVESDDASALFHYVSEWASLIDFEIEPVVTDEEAAGVLAGMV